MPTPILAKPQQASIEISQYCPKVVVLRTKNLSCQLADYVPLVAITAAAVLKIFSKILT